jgi:hypothetical protein
MSRLLIRWLCAFALLAAPCAYAKSRAAKSGDSDTAVTTAAEQTVTIPTQKRDVPSAVKRDVYKQSGIPKSERKGYVIDHKVPLELGGSNAKSNLQAQPKAQAKTKDEWENYLAGQVKEGKMPLSQAQAEVQQPHAGPPPKK